jgi:hypothetical protein
MDCISMGNEKQFIAIIADGPCGYAHLAPVGN